MKADLARYGEKVTCAVLGVDALYRRDAAERAGTQGADGDRLGGEGIVAVNLSKMPARRYPGWQEVLLDWEILRQHAGSLPDPRRREYYEDLATAIIALVTWSRAGAGHLGEPAFSELGRRTLGLDRLGFTSEEWQQARGSLHNRLAEAGYRHTNLQDALARWEDQRRVPASDVIPVLNDLLDSGRGLVEERMFPLPAERSIRAVGVRDVPYSAYCDFLASEMQVNLDQPYTLPELRHLVAHEAYPGHYTHLAVREVSASAGETTEDVLLVMTDTPTSPIFEGIGDNGLRFCWNVEPDDALVLDVFRMRILAVCRAALRLARGEPEESVQKELAAESGASMEWVEQRMRFLSFPLRRLFIFAYAWGERLVGDAYRAIGPGKREAFLSTLYRHHHSARSLCTI